MVLEGYLKNKYPSSTIELNYFRLSVEDRKIINVINYGVFLPRRNSRGIL